MKWEEYYEKINDWAISTAVNKISALEDMGDLYGCVDDELIIDIAKKYRIKRKL